MQSLDPWMEKHWTKTQIKKYICVLMDLFLTFCPILCVKKADSLNSPWAPPLPERHWCPWETVSAWFLSKYFAKTFDHVFPMMPLLQSLYGLSFFSPFRAALEHCRVFCFSFRREPGRSCSWAMADHSAAPPGDDRWNCKGGFFGPGSIW